MTTRSFFKETARVFKTLAVLNLFLILLLLPQSAKCEDDFYIRIGVEDFCHQQVDTVSIIMEEGSLYFGEFNFLIWYDSKIIELTNVFDGKELYSNTNGCGWKELSHQDVTKLLGPCDSGALVQVNGRIGNDNKLEDNQCLLPLTFPATLVNLEFKLTEFGRKGHYPVNSPVNFYWFDCFDNSLLSLSGSTLFAVDSIAGVYDHQNTYGSRTYIPWVSPTLSDKSFFEINELPEINISRNIFFRNGNLQAGYCQYIETNGDVNLNEFVLEPGDYSSFRSYLLRGISAFPIHPDAQLYLSDIDRNGKAGTLEDFVLLGRSVVGDTIPYYDPPECLDTAKIKLEYTYLQLNMESSDSLGALLLKFIGEFTPLIGFTQFMELDYHSTNDTTHVLIHRLAGGRAIQQGTVITGVTGNLIAAQAATYHGARVECVIVPDSTVKE